MSSEILKNEQKKLAENTHREIRIRNSKFGIRNNKVVKELK